MISHRKYTSRVKTLDVESDGRRIFVPATVDPRMINVLTVLSAVNVCWYGRVIGGGTVNSLAIHVGVQSGNVCVAIYANSGFGQSAVPGTRLVHSQRRSCTQEPSVAIRSHRLFWAACPIGRILS